MKNRKETFLVEYEALCRRYNLFVSPGAHSDDPAYLCTLVHPHPRGLPPEFWFADHMQELKSSKIDYERG